MSEIIKSKKRVREHGEVYTPEWLVKDMCNLIPQDTLLRIDSKVLEPSCGNGNFLTEILNRKLHTIPHETKNNMYRYMVFIAYTSLYGVDIQNDNVNECRQRLLNYLPRRLDGDKKVIEYVLFKNITCGNTLDEQTVLNVTDWVCVKGFVMQCVYNLHDLKTDNTLFGNADAQPHTIIAPVRWNKINPPEHLK